MGRGKSGMAGGGGGGSAKSRYDAASQEADAIAKRESNKPNGERWKGDSNQQYNDARRRQADAGSEYLLSHATDGMIEKAMDDYIDEAIRVEGKGPTQRWVKTLAGTKKDGSPTKRARENARVDRSDDIARELGRKMGVYYLPQWMSPQQHEKEMDRLAGPIMKAARKRMKGGSLK